jgi:hypothetical protein
VKAFFDTQFTIYAIARRGRDKTEATAGHSLEDEGQDVVEVMQSIEEPAFPLGPSYSAQTALAAAAQVPDLTNDFRRQDRAAISGQKRDLLLHLMAL